MPSYLRLYLRSDIVYASITRGNKFKVLPQHCKYDLRKHYFTNRVVPIWNSLPNDVVMADNINLFKNHLDTSSGHHVNLSIHIELNHSEPEV